MLDELAPVRVAALLLHWIPDLGCRVVQRGAPDLHVAAWNTQQGPSEDGRSLYLHPCEFRRLVIELMAATDAGLGEAVEPIDVELSARSRTSVGALGVVRHELDGGLGILAFAQLCETRRQHVPAAIPVEYDDDRDLGVTLVHTHFDDAASERAAYDGLVDLAATHAVADLAQLVARWPSV